MTDATTPFWDNGRFDYEAWKAALDAIVAEKGYELVWGLHYYVIDEPFHPRREDAK